ncbi:MAG: hypothetical protein L0Z50_33795 [Verrucomicrobiales bacterium]|nr:hypothetical protein [Verrucomicrobiales bacterium]
MEQLRSEERCTKAAQSSSSTETGPVIQFLQRFTGSGGDGTYPGALLEASDGALYGTTRETLFKLNKDGSGFRPLYHDVRLDGLMEGGDGVLYGATGRHQL